MDSSAGVFTELDRGLGPTVVLFRFDPPPAPAGQFGQPDKEEKEKRVAAMVDAIFEALPEASLVPPEDFECELADWRGAGDIALASAARNCGARTVAVLHLENYSGDLTVSLLPPYWSVRAGFRYRLRLVDADTAGLLLEADRGRDISGYFNALGAKDLDAEFMADLAGLLRAPLPAKAGS